LKPKILFIGASTGGPSLIEKLLHSLSSIDYTIVIAQHMKEEVLPIYIKNIQESIAIKVKQTPTCIASKEIIICSTSCKFIKKTNFLELVVNKQNQVYTPDINILFNSFIPYADEFESIAIILSGIGSDGVNGLIKLKEKGCFIIAQDEQTSPVYGMPKAVFESGIVDSVKSFDEIIKYVKSL